MELLLVGQNFSEIARETCNREYGQSNFPIRKKSFGRLASTYVATAVAVVVVAVVVASASKFI